MRQTKKGGQWRFGMKCHIGADAGSGLVHTIEVTAANEHDITTASKRIREDDEVVYGDSGYLGRQKRKELQSDGLSGSAVHDLTAAKQIIEDGISLNSGSLFADKAYIDAAWADSFMQNHAIRIFTPRKKHKGDSIISGGTVSTFVSSIRQPIECFLGPV